MKIANIIAIVAIGSVPSLAMAVDEVVKMKISDGLEAGKHTKDRIDDSVRLHFGSAKTPAFSKKIGEWDSNRRSMRKSLQERCDTAFVSALISLQQRAKREGGNAVVNITSETADGKTDSASDYACTTGRASASVRLRGTVVNLK